MKSLKLLSALAAAMSTSSLDFLGVHSSEKSNVTKPNRLSQKKRRHRARQAGKK